MESTDSISSESKVQVRRVRFGLQRSKPREFKWEAKKVVVLSKPKNSAEFKEIAKKELDLAASFVNDRASYDKFLDPDIVPTVKGSRRACGIRSTSLRKSGASSFEKVSNYGKTLSCSDRRYQINPKSPIEMTGTSVSEDHLLIYPSHVFFSLSLSFHCAFIFFILFFISNSENT